MAGNNNGTYNNQHRDNYQRDGQYQRGNQEESTIASGLISEIVKGNKTFSRVSPEVIIKAAEEIGKQLKADDLKNHQIRKFYDTVKNIEYITMRKKEDDISSEVAQLIFLRVNLAYVADGRGFSGISTLKNVMDKVLNSKAIVKKEDVAYFTKFFEAIIAYHK